MGFFGSLRPGMAALSSMPKAFGGIGRGGVLGAPKVAPAPTPAAGGRKRWGGLVGAAMAPQAAAAPEATAPQKPGSFFAKFMKR